jgi:DHA2 family methylenomycin A resistance protein-like MFS transporter
MRRVTERPTTRTSGSRGSSNKRQILLAASCMMAMLVLDSNAIGVVLPSMRSDFHLTATTSAAVAWVYLAALTAALPCAGAVSKAFGARCAFVIGVLAFGVASVGVGTAGDAPSLLFWRALAGIAAALSMPAALTLVTTAHRQGDAARAVSTYFAAGQVVALVGPAVAGALAQTASWRLAFLLNFPVALLAAALVRRASTTIDKPELSSRGARSRTVFRNRRVIYYTLALAGLGAIMTVLTVYVAVLVQERLHLSPSGSGAALLPMVVPLLIVSRWGIAWFPSRKCSALIGVGALTLGTVIIGGGLGLSAFIAVMIGLVPAGAGIALLLGPMSAEVTSAVARSDAHVASTIASFGRQFGSVMGVVGIGALLHTSGIAVAFTVLIGLGVLLAVPVWLAERPEHTPTRVPV